MGQPPGSGCSPRPYRSDRRRPDIAGRRQPFPAAAHPTDIAGGIAKHQGVIGYIPRDHCSGADEGIAADGDAADDGGIGADGRAPAHPGWPQLIHLSYFCPGIVDVGKDHTRSAEDIVFQGDTIVDRDVVLDLDVIADVDPVADIDILAQGTASADFCPGADVRPVPDAGAFSDLGAMVNDGAGVRLIRHETSVRQCFSGTGDNPRPSPWVHIADIGHGLDGHAVFLQAKAAAGQDFFIAAGVQVRETAGKLDFLAVHGDGAIRPLVLDSAASGRSAGSMDKNQRTRAFSYSR